MRSRTAGHSSCRKRLRSRFSSSSRTPSFTRRTDAPSRFGVFLQLPVCARGRQRVDQKIVGELADRRQQLSLTLNAERLTVNRSEVRLPESWSMQCLLD